MTYHDERMDLTDIYCTFCGKPAEDAMAIVAGPEDVFICEECEACTQYECGRCPNDPEDD